MHDMGIISTSTVFVSEKDKCRNRLPGEFGGRKLIHRTKSVKIVEVEQRSVIKFFSDEGMSRVQTVAHLREHHGEGALSQTQA
jgi:hypothetical protein